MDPLMSPDLAGKAACRWLHYLADVLVRIADHPAGRISELLPWNWTPAPAKLAA